MQMTEKVHINVGGVTFITRWSTLKKYPDTLLGALTSESGSYNAKENCFYFDRNPELFNAILDFYRNDAIHINNNVCPWIWKNELAFWKIPLTCLSECCYDTIAKFEKNKEIAKTLNDIFSETYAIQHKTSSLFEKLRHHLWRFLDEPNSSRYAKVCHLLICICYKSHSYYFTYNVYNIEFNYYKRVIKGTKVIAVIKGM